MTRPRHVPVHRDSADYDLPIGNWMCLACTMEALGVSKGHVWELVKAEHVEWRSAMSMQKTAKGYVTAAFMDADGVRALARKRASGVIADSSWMPQGRVLHGVVRSLRSDGVWGRR